MVLLKILGPNQNLVFQATVDSGDWPASGDFVAVPGVPQPGRVADREFVYGGAPGAPAGLMEVRCRVA
jgi:hypothetical protein